MFLSYKFSSADEMEVLQHDLQTSKERIFQWKAHILRAVHQDSAKTELLQELCPNQCVIVMDWAMKCIPRSYRETPAEWFGKKGRSWHVSVVITKGESFEVETFSVVHCY